MSSPIKRSVLIRNANLDVGWLEFLFVNILYQFGITRWNPRKNQLTEFEHRVSKDLLQPGDIIPAGQHRRISSLFIGGVFTHALVYVGDGKCVHVDGQGVRLVDYKWIFTEFDTMAILRIPKITPQQQHSFVDFMLSHIGEPFDYWFDEKDERAWFCSELICAGLRQEGFNLKICDVEKNLPHPSDFLTADFDIVYLSHCVEQKGSNVKVCYPNVHSDPKS